MYLQVLQGMETDHENSAQSHHQFADRSAAIDANSLEVAAASTVEESLG
jgi:hypothetical protein